MNVIEFILQTIILSVICYSAVLIEQSTSAPYWATIPFLIFMVMGIIHYAHVWFGKKQKPIEDDDL